MYEHNFIPEFQNENVLVSVWFYEFQKSFQLLEVQENWRYYALYVLQKDSDNSNVEIIAKLKLTETIKHEVNIHTNIPRRAKSIQTLVLKGEY